MLSINYTVPRTLFKEIGYSPLTWLTLKAATLETEVFVHGPSKDFGRSPASTPRRRLLHHAAVLFAADEMYV